MAIDRNLVGAPLEPVRFTYTWREPVLYALGVGARVDGELDYLYEGRGPRVLPTFAVVPAFRSLVGVVGKLGANPMAILHGEQTVRMHRAIPPAGEVDTRAEVTGIYDKGKGALVVVVARTTGGDGEPLFDNEYALFVRGEGGFGGPRGPEAREAAPPADQAPNFTETFTTSPEQAAVYRLSGDTNPLHIAPEAAAAARFERPILHGLCTYGVAGRAVVRAACAGDPVRLERFCARFSGVVFPGDTLTTRGWQVGPRRWVVEVAKEDGAVVLSHSEVDVADAAGDGAVG